MPRSSSTDTTHTCPRWPCPARVPEVRFACPKHWAELPADIQREIYRTASLSLLRPERRTAIAAARDYWRESEHGRR